MACYCQYCRFLYNAETTHCFSCGRPTTRDGLSPHNYIRDGYQAMEDLGHEEHQLNQNTTQTREATSAADVLQGENIVYTAVQNDNTNNYHDEFSNSSDIVNQELLNLRALQADEERQRRALNRQIRRQNRSARLITLPWPLIFRILLIILAGILLISIWNMRYTILSGISSILISFLPLILIIYLFISLIRGRFK